MARAAGGEAALGPEERRLLASTGTDGAIYRASRRGKLDDTVGWVKLTSEINFDLELHHAYKTAEFARFAVLEDHPRLDLRVLAASGFLQPGLCTQKCLIWDKPQLDCYVLLTLFHGQAPCVILIFKRERFVVRQVIALTLRQGDAPYRYRFVIDGHGRCEVLAYRFGRFAPPKLQRLVHASQRKPGPDPAARLEAALLKRAAAKSSRS